MNENTTISSRDRNFRQTQHARLGHFSVLQLSRSVAVPRA